MNKMGMFILSIMMILLISGCSTQELEIDRGIQPNSGSYTLSKVIDSYTLPDQFVDYSSSTPDWSYASGYTLHTGMRYSFSAAIPAKSAESHICLQFDADSSRASRLAVKSDVKVDEVLYTQYLNGKVVKTWTEIKTKAAGTKMIYVKYR